MSPLQCTEEEEEEEEEEDSVLTGQSISVTQNRSHPLIYSLTKDLQILINSLLYCTGNDGSVHRVLNCYSKDCRFESPLFLAVMWMMKCVFLKV